MRKLLLVALFVVVASPFAPRAAAAGPVVAHVEYFVPPPRPPAYVVRPPYRVAYRYRKCRHRWHRRHDRRCWHDDRRYRHYDRHHDRWDD